VVQYSAFIGKAYIVPPHYYFVILETLTVQVTWKGIACPVLTEGERWWRDLKFVVSKQSRPSVVLGTNTALYISPRLICALHL